MYCSVKVSSQVTRERTGRGKAAKTRTVLLCVMWKESGGALQRETRYYKSHGNARSRYSGKGEQSFSRGRPQEWIYSVLIQMLIRRKIAASTEHNPGGFGCTCANAVRSCPASTFCDVTIGRLADVPRMKPADELTINVACALHRDPSRN